MTPPANIALGRILVSMSLLPPDPIWVVWERMDSGAVSHMRCVGILAYRDGELAVDLCRRAEELARGRE